MPSNRLLMKEHPAAAVVLSLMCEHMDKTNAIAISHNSIADLTGYKRTAVTAAIKKLKEDRWIQIIKIGNANAYRVNSEAFWTTKLENKVFSKFNATIVASVEEQQQTIDELKAVKLQNSDWVKNVPAPFEKNT